MLFSIMHVIHLLTVIIWIGGLAFITMLVLPLLIRMQDPLQKVLFFQSIEHKFAPMARVYNLVVGISGIVMVLLTGWYRIFFTRPGVPLLFMSVIWLLWFVMLFGLEPLIVRKMLDRMAKRGDKMEIETIFGRLNRMHWLLLLISLAASAAGIIFAHGYL